MSTTDIRLDAIETPEGRAIYPFGAWGVGYLADAATERRLHAFLRRPVSVVVGLLMLQILVRHFIVPIPEWTMLLVTPVATCLLYYVVVKAILRGSARTSVKVSSDELLRLRLARGGRTSMVAALWCGVVVFVAIGFCVGITTEGVERWVVVAGSATAIVLTAVSLRRVRRIPE